MAKAKSTATRKATSAKKKAPARSKTSRSTAPRKTRATSSTKKSTKKAAVKTTVKSTAKTNGSDPRLHTNEIPYRRYEAENLTHTELGLSKKKVLDMYQNMLLQRRFEERAAQMYGQQKFGGFLHLYIGQEAVSTGTAGAMKKGDALITAYRDHGLGLALGMEPNACMAELFGKIDGCSRGKGGSMHFFDVEKGMLGGHGIVGGQIPLGVGASFAFKYKKTDNVCLTFFGDGAMQQGAFHEAANLAGLYNLPSILVCENNMYAMGTAVDRSSAIVDLYKRHSAYGMHGIVADGMDVFTMYKAMQDALALARKGEPVLMEVRTYRYRGHSMSDPMKYRTKEELEQKKDADPILRLKSYILEHKLATNNAMDKIDADIKKVVMDSVEFAENSPYPDPATMYEDVYAQEDYPFIV